MPNLPPLVTPQDIEHVKELRSRIGEIPADVFLLVLNDWLTHASIQGEGPMANNFRKMKRLALKNRDFIRAHSGLGGPVN